ncbi:isopentenyl-diphosphate Delta-isomerase 1-like isoform X1 [Photinus pyralis]|uniref:isopentenyl-diphosphate Delta-isomerase 1-like isoform X1 n=2 Tax=Photinus pyralis TaxID=7054 RepID=UPI0012673BFD|nr:isopentenyl-diphosphate Delta-isomerase 1-like isoform X1 [Photinus pyralis]
MICTVLRLGTKRCCPKWSSNLTRSCSTLDPTQVKLLNEMCFLVDDNDKVIGTATKKECHAVKEDGYLPLHRAFSVFLFNKKGDLLMQKRADTKITFPGYYSNSCCSHPLASVAGEDDVNDALGIKKAAIRRLNYELGIPRDHLPLDRFEYLTRVKYKIQGDGKWGEYEIDYILFFQDDVKLNPNPNEVSAIAYVPKSEFKSYLHTLDGPLSPWMNLIVKYRLAVWWDNLHDLSKFKDHTQIFHLS